MESDSDDKNSDYDRDIIGFKAQSNHASPDFRADLVLYSNELKHVRFLCATTKSEVEFQETIILILLLAHAIKTNSIFDNFSDVYSVSSMFSSDDNDENIMELSSVEPISMLSNFLEENGNDFFHMKMKSMIAHNRLDHLLLALDITFWLLTHSLPLLSTLLIFGEMLGRMLRDQTGL